MTTAKDTTLYYEISFRDFRGTLDTDQTPEEALKELMSLIVMNSRKVKWMKENVFITVSKNRNIEAWHNPDEPDQLKYKP